MKNLKKFLILGVSMLIIACSSDDDGVQITVTTADVTIDILDNVENGVVIGKVTGTTNSGSTTFSLTTQSPQGVLNVGSANGDISIADANLLDGTTTPVITAVVTVANGNVSETANITINVGNAINISAEDLTLTVQDDIENDTMLGQVVGTTNQGSITYTIASQTPDGAISINADTGELTVTDNSLFVADNTVTAEIILTNENVSATANVTINVEAAPDLINFNWNSGTTLTEGAEFTDDDIVSMTLDGITLEAAGQNLRADGNANQVFGFEFPEAIPTNPGDGDGFPLYTGNAEDTFTFTFNQAVNVQSIIAYDLYNAGDPDNFIEYTFIPTGGTNDNVTVTTADGIANVELNWSGVTSFVVEAVYTDGTTTIAVAGFDNLIVFQNP